MEFPIKSNGAISNFTLVIQKYNVSLSNTSFGFQTGEIIENDANKLITYHLSDTVFDESDSPDKILKIIINNPKSGIGYKIPNATI